MFLDFAFTTYLDTSKKLKTAAHIQQLSADYFWLCYLVGGQIAQLPIFCATP